MSKFYINTRPHSTMLIFRQILGITFLIAYETLFIYCLFWSIQGLERNQDDYDTFKNAHKSYQQYHDDASFYLEESNMDGYNSYLDFCVYTLLSSIFLAWPWIILIVLFCCRSPPPKAKEILPSDTNEPLFSKEPEIQYVEV